ncbi:AIPR family protein [bacterium]|nr:AIPR family protein [bacterium]
MKTLDELINEYYEKFVGLPNGKPIVRQNQKNDAFEIVVLETLYGKELNIDISKLHNSDVGKIAKYIVALPDDGIDIVVEKEDIDGNSYDFIQVKNSALDPVEIFNALTYMEATITSYINNPLSVGKNLREILAKTDFSKADADEDEDNKNCRYIIVHRGDTNCINKKKDYQEILTGKALEKIRYSEEIEIPRVRSHTFSSDSFNNSIVYEESKDNPAILMNIRGYDLAVLANDYMSTDKGRNILFGQNFREGLSEKSKTYDGMAKTIRDEPDKFWFYNNGITIIAEDFKEDKDNKIITLKEFSIINGAQTTSALGTFLQTAKMNKNKPDEECLKKVYVLARILKVKNHEFQSKIAVYNNTQNPITTRDMASNNPEQIALYWRLLHDEIYMEIRRGMKVPSNTQSLRLPYRKTTNLDLAQLAFAGFLKDPFTAKDKKNTIFDTDYKRPQYLLNEHYHKLFNNDPNKGALGILFKKSPEDINELLFVYYLYKLSKKSFLSICKNKIKEYQESKSKSNDESQITTLENQIKTREMMKNIANTCVFYCIAYYYSFKESFPSVDNGLVYKYKDFESNKDFKDKLIENFGELFLKGTIETIYKVTNMNYNNNWIRDKKSKGIFFEEINTQFQLDITGRLEKQYSEFIKTFKTPK